METYKVDMHVHTCYSDGDYTPNEVILSGKKSGLKAIAITDHDTILGNKNITLSKEEKEGIIIVPGTELSAKTDKGRLHILGYGIDINNQTLNEKMTELRNNSIYYIIGLITQLKKDYGITFSTEDIQELFNKEANIGRPDLARLCIKYGHAQSIQDAFNKYLEAANKKTKLTNKGISYQECIKLITDAKGVAVLAHPHTINKTDEELEVLLQQMIKCGLRGIEVYHSNHTPEMTQRYLRLANKYNLLISGGSDYHGDKTKPHIVLGSGINNNLKIKQFTLLENTKIRIV